MFKPIKDYDCFAAAMEPHCHFSLASFLLEEISFLKSIIVNALNSYIEMILF